MRNKLSRHITEKTAFTVECSVVAACQGEYTYDGPTIAAVAREMKAEGWLDDFIVEDTINLACPVCVEYCKENVKEFEELDRRAGGKAK